MLVGETVRVGCEEGDVSVVHDAERGEVDDSRDHVLEFVIVAAGRLRSRDGVVTGQAVVVLRIERNTRTGRCEVKHHAEREVNITSDTLWLEHERSSAVRRGFHDGIRIRHELCEMPVANRNLFEDSRFPVTRVLRHGEHELSGWIRFANDTTNCYALKLNFVIAQTEFQKIRHGVNGDDSL